MTVRYFSTNEIANQLGVSREYVNRLCRQGKLGRRIGRNWAISKKSLDRYMVGRLMTVQKESEEPS